MTNAEFCLPQRRTIKSNSVAVPPNGRVHAEELVHSLHELEEDMVWHEPRRDPTSYLLRAASNRELIEKARSDEVAIMDRKDTLIYEYKRVSRSDENFPS